MVRRVGTEFDIYEEISLMCFESQKEVATKPAGYGVVAIIRQENLFLAIRRGASLRAGGMVCFPGGHVEKGECEQEAVIRECREELSIYVAPQKEVWKSVTDWGTALSWWTADLLDPFCPVPHPIEVQEYFWFSLDDMMSHPDLLQGNQKFLEDVKLGVIQL
jgi:8-oxo-dGTP diphosphatase